MGNLGGPGGSLFVLSCNKKLLYMKLAMRPTQRKVEVNVTKSMNVANFFS